MYIWPLGGGLPGALPVSIKQIQTKNGPPFGESTSKKTYLWEGLTIQKQNMCREPLQAANDLNKDLNTGKAKYEIKVPN